MGVLKYRRIGLGEFAGHSQVCEFSDSQARAQPGAMSAAELTVKGAQKIIGEWNRNMPDSWRYELVTPQQTENVLVEALRDIGGRADMSVYDMATRARNALKEAGVEP